MYEIFAISPAYPGRINMWFERRKPGNTSAFTPGFRPRERHPRCRGRCPRVCGANKVLEDEDDRDLSVCRVLEVDVLVDENREDVDLEKKNLEGRSPMSRTSRKMSLMSKDRVQQIVNHVLDDLNVLLIIGRKVLELDEVMDVGEVPDIDDLVRDLDVRDSMTMPRPRYFDPKNVVRKVFEVLIVEVYVLVVWLLWTKSRRVDQRWRPCQPTNQSAAICLPLRQ